MVITGKWGGPLVRMTYSKNADGSVRQIGEQSTDEGKNWSPSFDFTYRKRRPRLSLRLTRCRRLLNGGACRKSIPMPEAALDGLLFDGMTIAAGGFGLCGIPERLIDAIVGERGQGPRHRVEQCRHRQ